jgi:hypothetical protein
MLSYRELPPSAPQRVIPDGHPELILTWNQPFESFQSGRWHRQLRVSWQARLTARCY